MNEDLVLDNTTNHDELSLDLAGELGLSVVTYHNTLPEEFVTDGHSRVAQVVHELLAALEVQSKWFRQEELDACRTQGLSELARCRELLDKRGAAGFFKRCQSELHLNNALKINQRPKPVDVLDVGEHVAASDVLYDLALLIMDLGYRGLDHQASIVFNKYLLHSNVENIRGLAAFPLFLFYHAGRGALNSAQSATHCLDAAQPIVAEAQQYLQLALHYLEKNTPQLIAIGGLSGSGKSTVAAQIPHVMTPRPGALLLRSDAERKVAMQLAETERIPASDYTSEASEANYRRLFEKASAALEAVFSVIVDAVFLAEKDRTAVAEVAIDQRTPFLGMWMDVPIDVMQKRVAERTGDASDATVEVLQAQSDRQIGEMTWHLVNAGGTAAGSLEQVHAVLNDSTRLLTSGMRQQAGGVMHAMVHDEYGAFDALELRDVDIPAIGENEILVRVHAAGLHVADCFSVKGAPFVMRMVTGVFKPKLGIPGFDVAGCVEVIGEKVTRFQPGDDVFGECNGACADYARVAEDRLALKPSNVTFQQAAAVPTSGLAALHALRDAGKLKSGQHVLINGAAGGVGTFAVQIAKALGAHVTGVCSTKNVDRMRAIGADHVVDYTQEDFTLSDERYDLILDNVENRTLSECRRVLAPRGTLIVNSGTGASGFKLLVRLVKPILLSPFVGQKLRRYLSLPNYKDLLVLKQFIETNEVVPVLDKTYALSETAAALAYIEDGHARGKVVV